MKTPKRWLGLLLAWSMAAGAVMASPHVRPLDLLSAMDTLPVADLANRLFARSDATPTSAPGPRATDGLYLVVDMSGGLEADRWPVSYLSAVPSGGWQYADKTAKLILRRVEAGSFMMGSLSWEFGRSDDEIRHQAVLTEPYYIAVFEFTQQQWMRATSYNPARYSGAARPVETVGYERIRGTNVGRAWPDHFDVDDDSFLGVLRLRTGLAFDLPTEAQWEYACRAGTTTALNTGKNLTAEDECPNMTEAGRYGYNQTDGKGGFDEAHTTVGSYLPNAWGLYDMHGNVGEWCLDWYTNYPSMAVTNPVGGPHPTIRVIRGGSWESTADNCRSAARNVWPSTYANGFRLVCPVRSTQKQTVTFDPNKGTCGTATQTNTILGVYETLPADVSRPGYLFDGWFTEPDGGRRVYISSMVTTDAARTLYAHWHPDIQLVTFDPNGGQCTQTTNSYTVDTTYRPLPEATRPGYIFDGWFSAATGGTLVTTESTVTTDLSRTLYAHWSPDKQTVTFQANGGTCATTAATYTVDSAYTPLPIPERAHYRFGGWFDIDLDRWGYWWEDETGTLWWDWDQQNGEIIAPTSVVTTASTREFWAHWTRSEQVVTFDPNGGSCSTTNRAYAIGAPYAAFPAATLPHHALVGWYTARNGDNRIDPADEVPARDTRTLYAHWTLVEQVATFDPNGGTCPETERTYTVGQPYASLPVATLEHYAAQWYTAPTGGDPVTETTIVPAIEYQTFHARWTRTEQIVTYDPNGGSCTTETQIQTIGQPYADLPAATLEHYVLAGWYTAPDGGDLVDGTTTVTAADTRTLYAHWTRVDQIVTFDPNGGTCDTETRIYTIGQPYANLPAATREHYVLDGWYTHPNYGYRVDETTTVSASDTLTLYAHWRRVDQIVTFNPNGGTCDIEIQIFTIGEPYASLPAATREHYALEGWYTQRNGGDRMDETTTVSATDTRTLYAHWTRVDQIVTFNPNGGTCATETQIFTIGGTYSPLPDAFLEHYVLEGWYTSADGGERMDATTTVTEANTLTLYAHWKRGDQIVTFDPNGGTCATESQVFTIGGPYSPLPNATREQYVLDGWYTDWSEGERVGETNVVTTVDTRQLYAHWKRLEAGSVQVVDSYQTAGTNITTIDFFGDGGKQYALQRSRQLGIDSEWSILDIIHADHTGIYTFTNIPPPGWQSGFYRVVEMEELTQYLVVDMSGGTSVEKWPVSMLEDVPDGGWTDEYKTDKLVLRRIPAPTPYYIGVFEVTQRQWELARGTRPSYFSNDLCYATRPVECIWHEDICGAIAFTHMRYNWQDYQYPRETMYEVDEDSFLGVLQAKTGLPFNLPTGEQWEFACRAGTTTAFNSGKELTDVYICPNMVEVGRYRYNGGVKDVQNRNHWNFWQDRQLKYFDASTIDTTMGTAKVGSYRPNAWGLYDMHGNVAEWCTVEHETWFDTYAPQRGGSCVGEAYECTASSGASQSCEGYDEADLRESRLETQGEGEGILDYGSGFRVYCPAEFPAAMLVDEYMVVDMSGGATATSWPVRPLNSIPEGGWSTAYKTTNLLLRRIVPGTFTMGSPETESDRSDDETQHEVKLSKPFYMGVFEVTQLQWELAMGTRPSWCRNSDYYAARPVECVDYSDIRGASLGTQWPLTNAVDAKSFFGVLRAKTGLVFDLPTEAQWEYSCRAATTTEFNSGGLGRYGLYDPWLSPDYYFLHLDYSIGDPSTGTAEVGSFRPNGWGLYDMHGNVGEWCLDWYGDYGTNTTVDPVGATSGTSRVIRGGGWYSKAPQCRSAARNDPKLRGYSIGFRACCSTELP